MGELQSKLPNIRFKKKGVDGGEIASDDAVAELENIIGAEDYSYCDLKVLECMFFFGSYTLRGEFHY